jgi:hypothetical protein
MAESVSAIVTGDHTTRDPQRIHDAAAGRTDAPEALMRAAGITGDQKTVGLLEGASCALPDLRPGHARRRRVP